MNQLNYKKYLLVFIITGVIFISAFWTSNFLNNKKINNIKTTEDKISIGILSLETQFELLQESTCTSLDRSALSTELGSLADKLSYAESHDEISSKEVSDLKKYYSLLEIKDYLLMKKVSQKCSFNPITIIYFYSNKNCDNCQKQGFVLTHLREKYPQLRVYTFDYDLDLPAIQTLITLHEIKNELPALVINDSTFNGFQDLEKVEKIITPLIPKDNATSTKAISTPAVPQKK